WLLGGPIASFSDDCPRPSAAGPYSSAFPDPPNQCLHIIPEAVGAEAQTLLRQSYGSLPFLGRTWVRYVGSISKTEKQEVCVKPIELSKIVEMCQAICVLVEGALPGGLS